MTNRYSDIYCNNCNRYLFSELPEDRDYDVDVYCDKKACKEAATAAKLQGDKVTVHKD